MYNMIAAASSMLVLPMRGRSGSFAHYGESAVTSETGKRIKDKEEGCTKTNEWLLVI